MSSEVVQGGKRLRGTAIQHFRGCVSAGTTPAHIALRFFCLTASHRNNKHASLLLPRVRILLSNVSTKTASGGARGSKQTS